MKSIFELGSMEICTWTKGQEYDRMIIRDLITEVRLGVHSWERHPEKPQRVIINIDMFADPRTKKTEDLASVINYDHIREAIRRWPSREHTELIEPLLDELLGLCFRDERVRACRVSIVKPDIYNDAAAAGVEVFRIRE